LKAAVDAARRLQMPELADWEAEFNDFWATFQKASKRDAKPMDGGLFYLPILMTPRERRRPRPRPMGFLPRRFPRKVVRGVGPDGPRHHEASGPARKRGSGSRHRLDAHGFWNYFASFWAHAHLWLGHGEKAAEILYAYANHASPLRAWREEQPPKGEKTKEPFVGDMPHNWASPNSSALSATSSSWRGRRAASSRRPARPWLAPGAKTTLRGVATDFGRSQ